MLDRGYAIPIIECHGRFHAPVFYDQELQIVSRVAEVRSRAFRVEHAVLRGDDLVGEGYEVRMWVKTPEPRETLQPQTIPDDLRRIMESGE